MKPVSAKMLVMLRQVAAAGPGMSSMGVPYRLGSINTARALFGRGLIDMFHGTNDQRRMFMTDAGRAYLALLPP